MLVMKTKYYCVFDLIPDFEVTPIQYTLEKVGEFDTQLEALKCIDEEKRGYGLTIMEVWE